MAKTVEQVNSDYRSAMREAARLEEIAGRIESTACNDFEGSMLVLSSAWQSDASHTFRKKGEKVSDQINDIVRDLRQEAEFIRQSAKIGFDTDLQRIRSKDRG